MKNLIRLLSLVTLTLLLSNCGKDGVKGDAYIALDWDWYVDAYNDNNPSLPASIGRNFDYKTSPGEYKCEYLCSDGSGDTWYWEYVYTIKINQGESGKLFRKGEDGKDRYHKLFLHGLAKPSFSHTDKNLNQPQKKLKDKLNSYSLNGEMNKVYLGEPIHEEFYQDGFIISVVRRKFILE